MKRLTALLVILLVLSSGPGYAQPMLMARSTLDAEVTMESLQQALEAYGYTIAHIQRCDGGLADFDYQTDYYRVVFFGKIEEVRNLSSKYPELIPYLPLKIAVFAEGAETILSSFNPVDLAEYFDDPALKFQLVRWYNDINAIFNDLRLAK